MPFEIHNKMSKQKLGFEQNDISEVSGDVFGFFGVIIFNIILLLIQKLQCI